MAVRDRIQWRSRAMDFGKGRIECFGAFCKVDKWGANIKDSNWVSWFDLWITPLEHQCDGWQFKLFNLHIGIICLALALYLFI